MSSEAESFPNGNGAGNERLSFDDNLSLGSFEGLSAELEAVETSDALKRRKLNASGDDDESSCSAFEKIMSCSLGGSPPRRTSTTSLLSRNKLDPRNCICLPGFFEAATKDKNAFDQILGPKRSLPAAPQRPASESRAKQASNTDRGSNTLKGWLDDVLGAPTPAPIQSAAPNMTASLDEDDEDDDEEVTTSCCPKPQKRVRKPASKTLSSEDKAELVKKRNREHAQATRRRQRMYIEYLKSQVEELSKQRQAAPGHVSHETQGLHPMPLQRAPSGDTIYEEATDDRLPRGAPKRGMGRNSADECIDIEIRHKAVALKFLELRTSEIDDPAHWGDVLAENCVVTMPSEPFRSLPGEVANNRHTLKGIAGAIADNKSMICFINSLNRQDAPPVTMMYRAEASKMMLFGEKIMCQWRFTTVGLRNRGLPNEVAVEGVMQASFNARRRLETVEFIYDVNALLQGFHDFRLIEDEKRRPGSPAPSDLTQATLVVPVARPVPIAEEEEEEDAAARAPTPLPRKLQNKSPIDNGGSAVIETRAVAPSSMTPITGADKLNVTSYPTMAALSQQAAWAMGFGQHAQMNYAPANMARPPAMAYPGLVQQPRPQFMMVPVMPNGMMANMPMMMPMGAGVVPMPMVHPSTHPGAMPQSQLPHQQYQ